ncbi:pentapeptide repeat-containing protein [Rhizobium rhizogenes]|uniref:hypothetical protein n=1 Tax=Rhizobium rhizogenes TaxID=359 RepID=UPI003ED16428
MDDATVGDKHKVPEWPAFSERHWYAASISLVIVGLTVGVFAGAWILSADKLLDMKERVEVAAPFATIFLALITFCTVAWRGMVSSRQADQQRRQNDANDEVNLAKLLQEGAKMLAEEARQAQVLAGIATLDIVIADPQKRLGIQAMDLVATYVQDHYGKEPLNVMINAALRVLANGETRGIISRIDGDFTRDPKNVHAYWMNIRGFSSINYRGGAMRGPTYKRVAQRPEEVMFVKVHLENCDIVQECMYFECTFEGCRFTSIYFGAFSDCIFRDCDFSSARVTSPIGETGKKILAKVKGSRNFYYADSPPFATGIDIDWANSLMVIDRRAAVRANDEQSG